MSIVYTLNEICRINYYRLPVAVRRTIRGVLTPIRSSLNKATLDVALNDLQAMSDYSSVGDKLISTLIASWDNVSFSANPAYLRACIQLAANAQGPILECGTGLTTLVMGVIAQKRSLSIWSLEHIPAWAGRTATILSQRGIDSVNICVCGLIDKGEYSWYDAPLDRMPYDFVLVVCDGPPAETHGGRYGMLPSVQGHLANGAKIIVDDMLRTGEQAAVQRWLQEYDCSAQIYGDQQSYAIVSYNER